MGGQFKRFFANVFPSSFHPTYSYYYNRKLPFTFDLHTNKLRKCLLFELTKSIWANTPTMLSIFRCICLQCFENTLASYPQFATFSGWECKFEFLKAAGVIINNDRKFFPISIIQLLLKRWEIANCDNMFVPVILHVWKLLLWSNLKEFYFYKIQ